MVIAAKEKDKAEDIGLLVLGLEIAAFIVLCSMMGENLSEPSWHLIHLQNFWVILMNPRLPLPGRQRSIVEKRVGVGKYSH